MDNCVCDFCADVLRDGVMRIELFEMELNLCKKCSQKSRHNILEVCTGCGAFQWVGCDWFIPDGVSCVKTQCPDCRRI